MTWGLIAKTGNGDVQVDADFQNFRIFQSGNCPTPTQPGSASEAWVSTINFPARANSPLFFVQPGFHYVGALGYGSGINSIDLRLKDEVQVPYALADEVGGNADASTYGLVVYDASSNVAIDSRERFMVVEDVVQFDPSNIPRVTAGSLKSVSDTLDPLNVAHASVPNAYYGILFFYAVRTTWLQPWPEPNFPRATHVAVIRQNNNTSADIAYLCFDLRPKSGFEGDTEDYDVIPEVGYVFVARASS